MKVPRCFKCGAKIKSLDLFCAIGLQKLLCLLILVTAISRSSGWDGKLRGVPGQDRAAVDITPNAEFGNNPSPRDELSSMLMTGIMASEKLEQHELIKMNAEKQKPNGRSKHQSGAIFLDTSRKFDFIKMMDMNRRGRMPMGMHEAKRFAESDKLKYGYKRGSMHKKQYWQKGREHLQKPLRWVNDMKNRKRHVGNDIRWNQMDLSGSNWPPPEQRIPFPQVNIADDATFKNVAVSSSMIVKPEESVIMENEKSERHPRMWWYEKSHGIPRGANENRNEWYWDGKRRSWTHRQDTGANQLI